MKRTIFLVLISFLFHFYTNFIDAQEINQRFSQKLDINYVIRDDGIVDVENNFNIKNLTSEKYLSDFTFSVSKIKPLLLSVEKNGIPLEFSESLNNDIMSVNIKMDESAVGKGESQEFTIKYSSDGLTKKTGDTWEVYIPKLSSIDDYDDLNVSLSIPKSFGEKSYISPIPIDVFDKSQSIIYKFNKERLSDNGISAAFGGFQLFSFTLNYHLQNDATKNEQKEIAIPPDTSFQSLIYSSIDPKPDNVIVDDDGNWLATFTLARHQRLDVVVKGYAKISSLPLKIYNPSTNTLNNNLKATSFWQTNNKDIRDLARQLKTPENIYNFVVETLNYNPDRATPNPQRLGAVDTLINPNDAICTEFSDLFIALSRAAGIPAREVNGYAYTENPDVKPISLVADVLHAWPEYWDKERKIWVPVDPTWGQTSGINYFDTMDLRHFTFVIHGNSDTNPYPPGSYKLGSYPQKDIFVSFGQLDKEYLPDVQIEAYSKNYLIFTRSIQTIIKNTGNVAVYNTTPKIYFDDNLAETDYVKVIPPYSEYSKSYNLSLNSLGKKMPGTIYFKYLDKEVSVKTKKGLLLISKIFLVFIIIIVLFVLIVKYYRSRKLKEIKKYEIF